MRCLCFSLIICGSTAARPNVHSSADSQKLNATREDLCSYCDRIMTVSPSMSVEWALFPPNPWPNFIKTFACTYKDDVAKMEAESSSSPCDGIDTKDTKLYEKCQEQEAKRKETLRKAENEYPSGLIWLVYECGACTMCQVRKWMHQKFKMMLSMLRRVKKAFWSLFGYKGIPKNEQAKQREFLNQNYKPSSFLGFVGANTSLHGQRISWDSSEEELYAYAQSALAIRHRNYTNLERLRDVSFMQSRMEETYQSGAFESSLVNSTLTMLDHVVERLKDTAHVSVLNTAACRKTFGEYINYNWNIAANLEFPSLAEAIISAFTGNILAVIKALIPELLVGVTPESKSHSIDMKACLRDAVQRNSMCSDERAVYACKVRTLQQLGTKVAYGNWITSKTADHWTKTAKALAEVSKNTCIDKAFKPPTSSDVHAAFSLDVCHTISKAVDADFDMDEDTADVALRLWSSFMNSANVGTGYATLSQQCDKIAAWATAYCASETACFQTDMDDAWFEKDGPKKQEASLANITRDEPNFKSAVAVNPPKKKKKKKPEEAAEEDAADTPAEVVQESALQEISRITTDEQKGWNDRWSKVWSVLYHRNQKGEVALWENAKVSFDHSKFPPPPWKESLDVWEVVSEFLDKSQENHEDQFHLKRMHGILKHIYKNDICV
eukprot:TRINITY_DN662_c1_g1_i1.p1 TRINITY_DN662_c1_g1~~TRINITY_DN662_c1_g1_i1.p1  ORF type:complete len:667 (+),score=75.23 TRINITY_DN662_c1_g1_i1:34-2034(+)